MNSHFKIFFAVAAAMALLIPAGALAKPKEDKPDKPDKHGELGGPQDKHGQFDEALDEQSDVPDEESDAPKQAKEPKLKLASVNVKGVVTANDGTTMVVTIEKASGHAKACKGLDLTFDVSQARFHTADNDADSDMDAMDILVGHSVKVRTKLALLRGRKTTCAAAEELALPARAVHNRTTPQVEEEVEAPEDEATDDEGIVDEEPEADEPEGDEGDESEEGDEPEETDEV